MIRRRALPIACIVLFSAAFPSLSLAADCWTCSNPPGVCFPGGIGKTICTTSCCPNRCNLSGVFCPGPDGRPTSAISDGFLERGVVQNAAAAQPGQDKWILVSAKVR